MQMIGIQFTWYGAGFTDWMLRGPDGNYVFCHRLKGNNLNTEAYMRTGNLPVRYEVLNESAKSKLRDDIDDETTVLPLESSRSFPNSGTVYVNNELISYSGVDHNNNNLTGCIRGSQLTNFSAGSIRTFNAGAAASHNKQQGVVLVSTTTSPIISHWGSAYLIDGRFDDDRGYIFSYAATGVSISTLKTTAFLIRLAPSVSNAVVGDLGERELLNRAQLLLSQISITSDDDPDGGALVIEGVLNPINYPKNPQDILWNGLSNPAAGGQPSFAQVALGGSVSWAGSQTPVIAATSVAGLLTTTMVTVQFTVQNQTRALHTSRNFFFVTNGTYDNADLPEVGDILAGTGIATGTFITAITRDASPGFTRIDMSQFPTSNQTANVTITVTAQGTANTYTNTNFLFFTEASWIESGARIGSLLAETVTAFPSNTRVSNVLFRKLNGVGVVRATFTQSSNSAIAASSSIDFDLTPPPHANPGELVFSFIANPGETATLDLEELKELTTTAIGGRGTFPNGPDVMAINVYKVKGEPVDANVLLRWGEAQA
jgi:hypothetical protein